MVNIAILDNGNFGINLSKFNHQNNFEQLKYVEVSTIRTGLNEISSSQNFPGHAGYDAHEDISFSLSLTANDPDSVHETVNLTYTAVTLPDWLTLTSNGLLQGTPANDHVGEHIVSVRVTDQHGASSEKSFELTVNNVNDAPTLEEIADTTIYEEDGFSYQLTAADVDVGDALSFVGISLPSWLSLSETGLLSGTPDDPQIGTHADRKSVV